MGKETVRVLKRLGRLEEQPGAGVHGAGAESEAALSTADTPSSCLRHQRTAASGYKSRSPHLHKPALPNLFYFVTVTEIDVECVAVVPVPVTVNV